jgi:hypothetical protein
MPDRLLALAVLVALENSGFEDLVRQALQIDGVSTLLELLPDPAQPFGPIAIVGGFHLLISLLPGLH